MIDTHPDSLIFGTSATPVRSDGVNTIDELFEGNRVSDLPLSTCIAKKIVPLPKYVGALYTLDDELEVLRKKIEKATNSKEEINIIEKLMDKPIYEMFNNGGNFVKVVDVVQKNEIGVYRSKTEAVKDMQKKFNVKINTTSICNLLSGKAKAPYKGRFMFYLVDDKTVHKLMSGYNKAN